MRVQLTRDQIIELFNNAKHQSDYLLGLFKLVVVDFDKVKNMNQFLRCNEYTNKLLVKKAVQFDKEYHPNVVSGGLILNSGPSSDGTEHLLDYEFEYDETKITWKE